MSDWREDEFERFVIERWCPHFETWQPLKAVHVNDERPLEDARSDAIKYAKAQDDLTCRIFHEKHRRGQHPHYREAVQMW